METKIFNKDNPSKIGIKTYSWIKYLATIGSSAILISLVLICMYSIGSQMFRNWTDNAVNGLIYGLWGFASLLIVCYLIWRIYLFKTTNYDYQTKEKTMFYFSMSFYLAIVILSLITIIIITWNNQTNNSIGIGAGIFINYVGSITGIVLCLVLSVVASILETMSRIGEQKYLYLKFDENRDEENFNDNGQVRNEQAINLIKQSEKKKHQKEVELKNKEALDDFFKKDDE